MALQAISINQNIGKFEGVWMAEKIVTIGRQSMYFVAARKIHLKLMHVCASCGFSAFSLKTLGSRCMPSGAEHR